MNKEEEEEYKSRVEEELEEEDEDAIIERRRKERQKLLEAMHSQTPPVAVAAAAQSPVLRGLEKTSVSDIQVEDKTDDKVDNGVEAKVEESIRNDEEINGDLKVNGDEVEKDINKEKEKVPDMFADEGGNIDLSLELDNHGKIGGAQLLDANVHLTDNWDDDEGYYRTRSSELLGN
eukprot:Awhi_evm1s3060